MNTTDNMGPLTRLIMNDAAGRKLLLVLVVLAVVVPFCNLVFEPGSFFHISTYTMTLLGKYLCYALLAIAVGLSVLVPYIGAAVVTVPIALVGYVQWGWTDSFIWLMVVYGIIQALDGNVLVPLLFSEVVNLHPVAIIVAVLVFGGLWGFWGVFFAIPLATLLKAVMQAWPESVADVAGGEE